MKLTCSKCNAESEQPAHARKGSHYEYTCENEKCGVLLQGDFKGSAAGAGGIDAGPIEPCHHSDRKDPAAHLFYDTELLASARKGVTGFQKA